MYTLLTTIALLHAFHISVTEIEINPNGQLEVVMSVFADDLEKAVNLNVKNASLDIFNEQYYGLQTELIGEYISRCIALQIDDQAIPLNYIGHELEENRCLIYLEGESSEKSGVLTFKNYTLMNVYADQQNIVHLKKNQVRETFLLQTKQDELNYLLNL